jgi:serine/threonine protein kinase
METAASLENRCKACAAPLAGDTTGTLAGTCPACLLRTVLNFNPPAMDAGAAFTTAPEGYEVLEPLGRGGMGVVHKAHWAASGRIVALKRLAPGPAKDPVLVERFLREAETMARLDHPGIVTVLDRGVTAEGPFFTMPFIEGGSLRERIHAGPVAAADALTWIQQVAQALEFAHAHGVVHRDVKPGNILLDDSERAKLTDFGLAKLAEHDITLTRSGAAMGTLYYMAPEQLRSTAAVDARADVYSLGVMLYELLMGRPPALDYAAPSKAGHDPRLDAVIHRCLKENPAERYASMADLIRDLEVISTPKSPPRTLRRYLIALAIVVIAIAYFAMNPANVEPVIAPPQPDDVDPLLSPDYEWSAPANLGRGVNSEREEGAPFVTADGLTLVFRSDRPGGHGESDLWQSTRATPDQPFGELVNLGPFINSPVGEDAPCLSADGLTLYYTSTRGNVGFNFDIWRSRRDSITAPWQEPVKLPEGINTRAAEFRPWLSQDGLRLTFSSTRPPEEGVYVCTRASLDDEFGPPRPLCADFNRRQLSSVSFSADGRSLFCHRFNAYFPGDLLWFARITDAANPFANLRSFGPTVNTRAIEVLPMTPDNGRTVYYASNRTGGAGGSDLWRTHRIRKP